MLPPPQRVSAEYTLTFESIAEPQVLKEWSEPSPSKVYHTPAPGAASHPATPLGAPSAVEPPVEPVVTVLHSKVMASAHASFTAVTPSKSQEPSSWLASMS